MTNGASRVVLITGASSGIGRASADVRSRAGRIDGAVEETGIGQKCCKRSKGATACNGRSARRPF